MTATNETRKLPTRPGWWLADMSEWYGRETRPEPVELIPGPGGLEFDGMFDDEPFDKQLRLLAPIPGPEVLAALESYSDMLVALPDGLDFWGERLEDLQDDLADAIRAERDGVA